MLRVLVSRILSHASHLALTTILGGRSYPHLTHEVTERQRLSDLTKVSEGCHLNSRLRPSNSMFFILYYIPALYLASLKVDMMLGFRIFCDFIVIIIIIKNAGRVLNSIPKSPPSEY